MWLLLVTLVARAEVPLPDYDRELATAAWYEVNRAIEDGRHEEAVKLAAAFQETVVPDARLEYLTGLAWRGAGDASRAERHYRRAVEMDASRSDAWYDLGELLQSQGRLDEAEVAFRHVADNLTTGREAWLGPWRLAEVAALRKDPVAFEENMREALRRGFELRRIAGMPNWKTFYADPGLRDSIDKLVTVYGSEDILETLRP